MEARSSIPVDAGGGVRKTITSRRGLVIEIDPVSMLSNSSLAIRAATSANERVQAQALLTDSHLWRATEPWGSP